MVVDQVACEAKRVGLNANSDKKFMARHCSHLTDRSTGDGYVQSNGPIKVKLNVPSQVIGWQSNIVYDVTIVVEISASGQWSGRFYTDGSFQNDCLINTERDKYCEHETSYANLSQGFLPFAVSSVRLGGMGDELLRFLYLLAKLEVDKMGMPALSDQHSGFLRAKCFAVSTSLIGDTINKATAMRLMGVPSAPIVPPPPRRHQGWIVYNLTDWLQNGSSWALS